MNAVLVRGLVGTLIVSGMVAWTTLASRVSRSAEPSLIRIDGSSTVYPPTEAVAEEFQKAARGGTRVVVGISGTGGGFKKFCRGETDISDASRPILKEEADLCRKNGIRYYELPIAFDALTVAVSPHNTWVASLTVDELKAMWEPAAQARITRWNQVRPDWPDVPLALFGAGSDSGTFDYFTEAVVGKAKASRGDYTASEDDNVLVQGIESNKHALGYIPFAYYAAHAGRLKAVAIDAGQGPVLPSLENVTKGRYHPLSRPLFIYVKEAAATRPEVRAFVEYYLTQGPKLIAEVGYLPLPDRAYKMGLDRFRSGRLGSGFSGVPEVDLPVEEILNRPPKL
jgi:phosphate transport system substrate-binding protein